MDKTKIFFRLAWLLVAVLSVLAVAMAVKSNLLHEPYRLVMVHTNEPIRYVLMGMVGLLFSLFVGVIFGNAVNLAMWLCFIFIAGFLYILTNGYLTGPYIAYLNWFIVTFRPNENQFVLVRFGTPVVLFCLVSGVCYMLYYVVHGRRKEREYWEREEALNAPHEYL